MCCCHLIILFPRLLFLFASCFPRRVASRRVASRPRSINCNNKRNAQLVPSTRPLLSAFIPTSSRTEVTTTKTTTSTPPTTTSDYICKTPFSSLFCFLDVSPYAHCVFRAFDTQHNGIINFEVRLDDTLFL